MPNCSRAVVCAHRLLERGLRQADGGAGDRDPEGGERGEHQLEALALARRAGGRAGTRTSSKHDVAEHVRRDDLVRVVSYAGRVGRHEDERVAVALAGQHAVEVGVAGVGDERLVAVDDQLVAVAR